MPTATGPDEPRVDIIDRVRKLAPGLLEPREPGPPTWEEQVLALLREQTGLLREIRDRLMRSGEGG